MFAVRSVWLPPESSSEATLNPSYRDHSNKVILFVNSHQIAAFVMLCSHLTSAFAPTSISSNNRYHVKALIQEPKRVEVNDRTLGWKWERKGIYCTLFCVKTKVYDTEILS